MSLHDEIEAEMAGYAAASTAGLDLCTYTCLVLGDERRETDRERAQRSERQRQARRAADPGLDARERERKRREAKARRDRRRLAAV